MAIDVYRRLAKHLDDLPGGFPATESGVEIRLLKRFFTHEEAELAMCLSLIAEQPRVIARRIKLPVDETARRLDEMSRKGLIMCAEAEDGGAMEYMAAQYVIGIWEFNVNNLDQDLIADMNEYIPTLFNEDAWRKSPQIRTIPISRSLLPEHSVLVYDQAEDIVRSRKKFAVAPCICRHEKNITGHGCDRPQDGCLIFDMAADYYQHNNIGRTIDLVETLDYIQMAEEKALVLQPSNSQSPINICMCCGCCCGVLRTIKNFPRPAELTGSGYLVQLDQEACVGCETCLMRCQMEAIIPGAEKVAINEERCIGCGLCITTCPTDALSLKAKPVTARPEVPKDTVQAAIHLGKSRGKLSPWHMTKMLVQSKLDRLLAPR